VSKFGGKSFRPKMSFVKSIPVNTTDHPECRGDHSGERYREIAADRPLSATHFLSKKKNSVICRNSPKT
jgi:hypothetical protein